MGGAETYKDPKRVLYVDQSINTYDSIRVDQGKYKVVNINESISTAGLVTYVAVVVIDKRNKKQYLAHFDASSTPEYIRYTFDGFNLNESDIYLLEGAMPSGVRNNIYKALREDKRALKRLKLIHLVSGDPIMNGIVVKGGELYVGDTFKKT